MAWELTFMEWAGGWWSLPFLDRVIPWATHLGSHLAFVLFLTVSCLIIRRREFILRFLLLYGIASGILYGLKYLIQRSRPFHFLTAASKLSRGPGEMLDPSFPSGHTLYAFMMATLLACWFPRHRFLFFILAVFIGWTRVYLHLHYPTDVLAGGLIGYGVTALFLHFHLSDNIGSGSTRPHHSARKAKNGENDVLTETGESGNFSNTESKNK